MSHSPQPGSGASGRFLRPGRVLRGASSAGVPDSRKACLGPRNDGARGRHCPLVLVIGHGFVDSRLAVHDGVVRERSRPSEKTLGCGPRPHGRVRDRMSAKIRSIGFPL